METWNIVFRSTLEPFQNADKCTDKYKNKYKTKDKYKSRRSATISREISKSLPARKRSMAVLLNSKLRIDWLLCRSGVGRASRQNGLGGYAGFNHLKSWQFRNIVVCHFAICDLKHCVWRHCNLEHCNLQFAICICHLKHYGWRHCNLKHCNLQFENIVVEIIAIWKHCVVLRYCKLKALWQWGSKRDTFASFQHQYFRAHNCGTGDVGKK